MAWPPRGLHGAHGGSPVSTGDAAAEVFDASRASFEDLVGWVEGDQAAALTHAELEEQLEVPGPGAAAATVPGPSRPACDARAAPWRSSMPRASRTARSRRGHVRPLATIFGHGAGQPLGLPAARARQPAPGDALLNLPAERHSHGLRRLAAIESSRGSFEDAAAAVGRATGQRWASARSSTSPAAPRATVEDFYADSRRRPPTPGDVLVISCDGKGVVMRPDALRPATAKAAAAGTTKLGDPALQGREAQPQADGRGRRRL